MREIDIDTLAELVEGGTPVIDVRETDEYAEGHVPGAVNFPMGQLASRLEEIDRTSPVPVICASGNRSAAMTDVLLTQGFDAINVRGGTSAWIRSGRPIEMGTKR